MEHYGFDVTGSKVSQLVVQSCQESDTVKTQYASRAFPPIWMKVGLFFELTNLQFLVSRKTTFVVVL